MPQPAVRQGCSDEHAFVTAPEDFSTKNLI